MAYFDEDHRGARGKVRFLRFATTTSDANVLFIVLETVWSGDWVRDERGSVCYLDLLSGYKKSVIGVQR